jgi:hypothetical protein
MKTVKSDIASLEGNGVWFLGVWPNTKIPKHPNTLVRSAKLSDQPGFSIPSETDEAEENAP